jgi:hypothetical protein
MLTYKAVHNFLANEDLSTDISKLVKLSKMA